MRWFRRRGKKSQLSGESREIAALEEGSEPETKMEVEPEPEPAPKQGSGRGGAPRPRYKRRNHRVDSTATKQREPQPDAAPRGFSSGKVRTKKSHRIEPRPRCVSCRRYIDPEDLRPDPMGERGLWDIAANLGLTREDLAGPIADVSAQLYARRCDRCNSWMCHVCVDKVTGHGRRPARHQSCGGIFRPKQVG